MSYNPGGGGGGSLTTDSDTALSNPSAGQVLGYDGTLAKWENQTPKGSLVINVKDAPYNAKGDGTTDDTTAIQTAINYARDNGGSVFIPVGTYIVSSLTLDYTSVTAQSSSGAPYGFRAPVISGAGKRVTILQQKSGSTGIIYSVLGKLGSNAGPGGNNKVTGHVFKDMELVGVSTGSHGLSIESVWDSKFENLVIRNCGGSGIYQARVATVPSNDEYAFDLTFDSIRSTVNARYGLEHSITNAIGGMFIDCDFTANVLGGSYVCPSDLKFDTCTWVGNSQGTNTGYAVQSVKATATSTNNSLTFDTCRFENNSDVGGYDVKIDYCEAFMFNSCAWYSTHGEHSLGVGLLASGNLMHSGQVLGGYFTGDSTTSTQQAIVLGTDARDTFVLNPDFNYSGFNNGGLLTPNSLITSNDPTASFLFNKSIRFNSSGYIEFPRQLGAISNPGTTTLRLYNRSSPNVSSKTTVAVRFPSGAEQIIAAEPENGSDPGRITWGTTAPSAGTWAVGDVCFNKTPASLGTPGWVCTTAGTPGTWSTMASLAN